MNGHVDPFKLEAPYVLLRGCNVFKAPVSSLPLCVDV